MAILRRLLSASRLSQYRKVPTSATVVSRGFCGRTIQLRLLKTLSASRAIPIVPGNTIDNVNSRNYATTKKTTAKKTTIKKKVPAKKTTTKKAVKKSKSKAVKKKVVKKRKVAKKPKKPTRPKILDIPSPRGVSGYVVFIQERLKTVTGPGAPGRLSNAVTEWKALSDAEKQVLYLTKKSWM